MAKLECELNGDFMTILRDLEQAVMGGSVTAKLEDASDFSSEHAACAVRVFERYSWLGGNRVSLSFTLLQADGRIHLSAITSGGSQAIVFKINTFGEEAFLDTIRGAVNRYVRAPQW